MSHADIVTLPVDALGAYLEEDRPTSGVMNMPDEEYAEYAIARDAAMAQGRKLGPLEWRNGGR